ncbi:hypothetical protein, partial [uncultured Bifidobacterium sp.]|uniref:hypothetical protein n=1 Tax=uncultured Bifidobacterium sp. TaxID=165187 RepID=UPI002592343A
ASQEAKALSVAHNNSRSHGNAARSEPTGSPPGFPLNGSASQEAKALSVAHNNKRGEPPIEVPLFCFLTFG